MRMSTEAVDKYAVERERMVRDQIEARHVRDPRVLQAMRVTPRHLFVPENVRADAYRDGPLPIGMGQTISQPYIVASMTEILGCAKNLRVLEIGTGSGYQAAILSQLSKAVFSIEIVPELGARAAALLRKLRYDNVTVRIGDGYLGWPEQAPFDRIILTAAPPELPQALVDQLAHGGRLLAPVGPSPLDQDLMLVEKDMKSGVTRRLLYGVRFVPMVKPK
jgi:protein-L-isoaspartate(D-aspartate) O-methyltransferase